jgi:hypothetical protein
MNRSTADGFAAFYREYARTWAHAVATAALTAFGTLTFVHPGFAVVALAAYGLPPVVLYARGRGRRPRVRRRHHSTTWRWRGAPRAGRPRETGGASRSGAEALRAVALGDGTVVERRR